jgi:hypothetical protein
LVKITSCHYAINKGGREAGRQAGRQKRAVIKLPYLIGSAES